MFPQLSVSELREPDVKTSTLNISEKFEEI